MDLKIYKLLKNLERDFNNKYQISSLRFLASDGDIKDISINVLKDEVIEHKITMPKLIDNLIFELNKEGLSYKHGNTNNSPLESSDLDNNGAIDSKTTELIYHIILS